MMGESPKRSRMNKVVVVGASVATLAVAIWLLRAPRRLAISGTPPPAAAVATSSPVATQAVATARLPATAASSVVSSTVAEPIQAFDDWLRRYRAADALQRAALNAEGVALAQARRPILKDWIQSDPRRALDAAVPMVARQELP